MKSCSFLILVCLLFFSCNKEERLSKPDFDVTLSKLTYKVNDTVKFDLKGNADIISFYSGEFGKQYSFINGRIIDVSSKLSFNTQIPTAGVQEDQMKVLISYDFNGEYTLENVKKAKWEDITGRFTLASNSNGTSLVPSGIVDVSDLAEKGKSIYFAFHYIAKPQQTDGKPKEWRFRDLLLEEQSTVGNTPLMTQATGAWKIVLEGPYEAGRVTTNTTQFTFRPNATTTSVLHEAWGISAAVNLRKQIDLGADWAISVKQVSDKHLPSYAHVYTKPGTYIASFIAKNATISGSNEVIKHIEFTVLP